MKIENFQRLLDKMNARAQKALREIRQSVIVGYTAKYALFIHENDQIWPPGMRLKGLPRSGEIRRASGFGNQRVVTTGHKASKGKGFFWDPQGRATFKFLEEPARRMSKLIGATIRAVVMAGYPMSQALLRAGMLLQRESMQRVPVDTGALKASAFTKLEQ
jgi:hypothetical protein